VVVEVVAATVVGGDVVAITTVVTGVATVDGGAGRETAGEAEVVDPVSPAHEDSANNDAVRTPR
jgi:hypothetical protein